MATSLHFATGQILKKTGRSCEGVDFSWLSSKVSGTAKAASGGFAGGQSARAGVGHRPFSVPPFRGKDRHFIHDSLCLCTLRDLKKMEYHILCRYTLPALEDHGRIGASAVDLPSFAFLHRHPQRRILQVSVLLVASFNQ